MESPWIRIKLLPLLTWKIHIAEISVEGLSVNLLANEKGAVNWISHQALEEPSSAAEPEKEKPPQHQQPELTSDSLVLTHLILEGCKSQLLEQLSKPAFAVSVT